MVEEMAGSEVIYETDDVAVIMVPATGSSKAVVTFTPRLPGPRPGPVNKLEGFGRKFFVNLGVTAFHVVPKWNHWWQCPGISEAMDSILRNMPEGKEIWTYGASMGGTGALMFAKRLGAAGVLSLYPQASVDLERANFDPRWMEDRKRLDHYDDDWLSKALPEDTWLISDPEFSLDQQHIDMIRKGHEHARHVSLFFSDHSCMRMLQECGLLSSTVGGVLDGSFDPKAFRNDIRRTRRQSPVALIGAANALARRGKPRLAIKYSTAAVSLLAQQRQAGKSLDPATTILALHHHTNYIVRARDRAAATELLSHLKHDPLVAADYDWQKLQLSFISGDRNEARRLFLKRNREGLMTPQWQKAMDGCIRNKFFPPRQLATLAHYLQRPYIENENAWRIQGDVLVTDKDIAFLIGGNHSVLDFVTGELSPKPQSIQSFGYNISRRHQTAKEYDAPYLHVIFPDKQSVLSDLFPFEPINRLGDAYYDSLDPKLKNLVLWPVDRLKKESEPPFLPLDTHMTDHGSLAVLRMMLEAVDIEAPDALARIKERIVRQQRWPGDLGSKFDPPLYQTGMLLAPDWPQDVYRSPGGFNDGMIDIVFNPEASEKKTVLLFGDSFFRMMLKHLSAVFSTVVCLRTRFFHSEMVALIRPDVIFTGNAERYLSAVTPDTEANAFWLYPHLRGSTDVALDDDFRNALDAVTSPRSSRSKAYYRHIGLNDD